MTKALLLVDIQNDYFPNGKMALSKINDAADNAQVVLNDFRKKGLPIYHIQHIANRPSATFFLPNTEGVEINARVSPLPEEMVIQKHFPNSFRDTTLLETLKAAKVDELIIVGAMSHMCIDATTRAAFDYGFACTVIEDACATKNLMFGELEVPASHVHAGFMSALHGIYAHVMTTKRFIRGE